MSLAVVPEWVAMSAADVANVGAAIEAASAAAAAQTTGLLAAAEDEVSTAIAALFSAHGQGYQAVTTEAALFHDGFVQALNDAGAAYVAAEAANAAPLAAVADGFGTLRGIVTGFANTILTQIFGAPAAPAFGTGDTAKYTGTPSLITRLEIAALTPVNSLLNLSGLGNQPVGPGNPLLSLLTGDNPLLSIGISNSPPRLLTWLLGETVSYSTYDGMRVVQITPAHPTGEYVVALHGGAFIFPPSIFHWLHYSVMAHQTGATVQVPIYPLLQQGGTAGVVVPQIAGFISSQIGLHGASNVSVIGDSAGGNLALAAAQYLVANAQAVPASMVLLSPALDMGMTNPNIAFVRDPVLGGFGGGSLGTVWAGDLPITDYRVSPLYGSLSGLPPTYVYSGSMDILSPDVLVLQQLAATADAPFHFVLAHGQIHDWIILTLDGPRYWAQINQQLGIAA